VRFAAGFAYVNGECKFEVGFATSKARPVARNVSPSKQLRRADDSFPLSLF